VTFSTGPTNILTISWNRITVASNNGIILCAGMARFMSAARFCRTFDELRQFFRFRTTIGQSVSLARQRDLFHERLDVFSPDFESVMLRQVVAPCLVDPCVPSSDASLSTTRGGVSLAWRKYRRFAKKAH